MKSTFEDLEGIQETLMLNKDVHVGQFWKLLFQAPPL